MMPLAQLKQAPREGQRINELDAWHNLIRETIKRAYKDSRGEVGSMRYGRSAYDVIMDARAYFQDGRFELHCDWLNADPDTVLAGMRQIEKDGEN